MYVIVVLHLVIPFVFLPKSPRLDILSSPALPRLMPGTRALRTKQSRNIPLRPEGTKVEETLGEKSVWGPKDVGSAEGGMVPRWGGCWLCRQPSEEGGMFQAEELTGGKTQGLAIS